MHLKVKFKGTKLGLLWAAVEPLLIFVLLYVVFTSVRESIREDFAIYLISGIVLFHVFIKGTNNGLTSFRDYSPIIKSISINKELFPVIVTGAMAILSIVELAVFFGLMPFFGFTPPWTVAFLPVVFLLLLGLVLGLSYLLSIAFVYFRDIQPLWGVFAYSMIFVSPIFWYVEDAFEPLLTIQKINPLGQLIEFSHQLVFGNVPSLNDWLYTSGIILVILFVGYYLFQKFNIKAVEKL